MPAMLAANKDLIATLPTRVARMQANNDSIVIKEPPFFIPEFELTMAWSPLLQHHPAHRWLRQLILHVARQVIAEEEQIAPIQDALHDGSMHTQPIELEEIDPDRQ
jgi:DNA-binding transcriptional LysR family regulator